MFTSDTTTRCRVPAKSASARTSSATSLRLLFSAEFDNITFSIKLEIDIRKESFFVAFQYRTPEPIASLSRASIRAGDNKSANVSSSSGLGSRNDEA